MTDYHKNIRIESSKGAQNALVAKLQSHIAQVAQSKDAENEKQQRHIPTHQKPDSTTPDYKDADRSEDITQDDQIDQQSWHHPYLYRRPAIRKGRWTSDEHERFQYSLRIYGKDWRMIQWKVGTRDRKNIMAHAQKFKLKMEKLVQKSKSDEEIEDAKRYIIILESKQHKTFSNQLKQFQGANEAENTPQRPGIFVATDEQNVVEEEQDYNAPICVQPDQQIDEFAANDNCPTIEEDQETYEDIRQVMPEENRIGVAYQTKRDKKALMKLASAQYSIHTLHLQLESAVQALDISTVNRILQHVGINEILPGHDVSLLSYICGHSPDQFQECRDEYIRLLTLVIRLRPNLWLVDSQGWTCLHYAARSGNSLAIQAIFKAFSKLHANQIQATTEQEYALTLYQMLRTFICAEAHDGMTALEAVQDVESDEARLTTELALQEELDYVDQQIQALEPAEEEPVSGVIVQQPQVIDPQELNLANWQAYVQSQATEQHSSADLTVEQEAKRQRLE